MGENRCLSALSPHYVVVGAGIVGASIAYHLARRGARVSIVDAVFPASGATGKSFGWINATFSKRPRAYFDLNLAGIEGWHRLERDCGIRVQWGGSVAWVPDGDELRRDVEHHRKWGYPVRLIDRGEFEQLLPAVSPGEFEAACYCEAEGAVDPLAATAALLEHAQRFGAQLRFPSKVTSLDASGICVLACGVGLPQLVDIPLKDSPGVLVHLAPQPRIIDRVVLGPGFHCKQSLDGRIVAGGPVVAGAGTAITEASEQEAEQILRRLRRFVPAVQTRVERVTLGYRVMPIDEYPIVGFVDESRKIYVAATHSGVTLAPVIGELAAAEILDGVEAEALRPYRLRRFVEIGD